MKLSKLVWILVILVFFIVPTVSTQVSAALFEDPVKFINPADLTTEDKQFLNKTLPEPRAKVIVQKDKTSKYELHEDGVFFAGDKVQEYKLLDSDNSIINAYAILEVTNHRDSRLLGGLKFRGLRPRDIKTSVWTEELVTTEVPTYDIQCHNETVNETNSTDETNSTEICESVQNGTRSVTKEHDYWKPYDPDIVMPIGTYKVKITAKLVKANAIADWIVKAGNGNIDLERWAWWNSNWAYKREIDFTADVGHISYLNKITYDSHMNSDFSDLRFVDYATETTELNYTIEKKVDSSYAIVRVNSLGQDKVYMYYGNPSATSTESASDVFFNPLSYWYFDDDATDAIGSNDGTTHGGISLSSGKINNSYNYDGVDDYISYPATFSGSDSRTVAFWFYAGSYFSSTYHYPFAYGSNLDYHQFSLYIGGGSGSPTINFYYYPYVDTVSYDYVGWHHIVMSYDGSKVKGYIDGVKKVDTAHTLNTGTAERNTGKKVDEARYLPGKVDELIIWNRALTDSEAVKIYNITAPSFSVGSEQTNATASVSVGLNSPADSLTTSNTSLTFNWTITPSLVNLTNTTLYVWHDNGTLFNSSYFTLAGNESVTKTETYSFSADGTYIWNAEGCAEGVNCTMGTNRTFNIDTTAPTVDIQSPSGTYTYLQQYDNLTLNFSATDPHLDSCWYSYNGTNNSVSCSSGNYSNLSFVYVPDVNNLTVYANDTLGHLADEFTSWTYEVLVFNHTYNNETIEGSTETYLARTELGPGVTVSSIRFIYDGTSYSAESYTDGVYTVLRKQDFIVPLVTADTNKTFYFNVTLDNGDEIELTHHNQTVYDISADNCSSYSDQILEFTNHDEDTKDVVGSGSNSTIEVAFNMYSYDKSTLVLNYSVKSTNNPTKICLSRSLLNDTQYKYDTIVKYYTDEHATEYYNIVGSTLTNDTSLTNVSLYDLKSTESTDFQLTFYGDDYLPEENVLVYVNRQYVSDNNFMTVELPKTDYNGQTVLHLVRNDVIYNMVAIKDGEVLGEFNNLVAFCEDYTIGNCKINLYASTNSTTALDTDEFYGITFSSVTFNETEHTVYFNFYSTDGTEKTVQLNVTRDSMFGNGTEVCDTSLTAVGGTLTCVLPSNIEDSMLNVYVWVDGSLIYTSNFATSSENYGAAGYLVAFVMALSLILLFSSSKVGVLVSIIISFIGAISLGLITDSVTGLSSAAIWLIAVVLIALYKINKERFS